MEFSISFEIIISMRDESFEDGFEKEIERENFTSIDEFVLAKCWDVQRKYFEILTGELYSTDWISGIGRYSLANRKLCLR